MKWRYQVVQKSKKYIFVYKLLFFVLYSNTCDSSVRNWNEFFALKPTRLQCSNITGGKNKWCDAGGGKVNTPKCYK